MFASDFVISCIMWGHTNRETTQFYEKKGAFSFIIFLPLWWPIEPKFPQFVYYIHYVGIHQVRIQVFDNYQRIPSGACLYNTSIVNTSSSWLCAWQIPCPLRIFCLKVNIFMRADNCVPCSQLEQANTVNYWLFSRAILSYNPKTSFNTIWVEVKT